MWSAIGSYVGYGAQATEQPKISCAWPLQPYTKETAQEIAAKHKEEFKALLYSSKWQMMDWTDPEKDQGGDLRMWHQEQVGTYHFTKCTLSLRNTTPAKVAALVASEDITTRQKFSGDLIGLEYLERPAEGLSLCYVQYWAPPPVAGRDFVFLVSQETAEDGTVTIIGCSVDSDQRKEGCEGYVRSATFWGWSITQVGPDVMVNYCNCTDPRGWCPPFLFSWMKTVASREFIAIRGVISGKDVQAERIDLAEAGVSKEEVAQQIKAHEQAVEAPKQ